MTSRRGPIAGQPSGAEDSAPPVDLSRGSEQVRIDDERQRGNERLRMAFEAARMLAWEANLATREIHVSDNASELLGLPSDRMLDRLDDALALLHPEDRPDLEAALERAAQEGGAQARRFRIIRPDNGAIRWFEWRAVTSRPSAEGVQLRGVVMDVTESVEAEEARFMSEARLEEALQRTEDQLRQSQKMEAIGRLAGGVAHDFNNLLSVVLSYSAFALSALDPDDPVAADVREIQSAGQRAADLTHQLLAFSRQQMLAPAIVDLNEVARHTDTMLRRLIGEDVDLRTVTPPGIGKVKVDRGQIEQVIMNLAINARDAMPDGGTLTIETADVLLDDEYASHHVGVKVGAHVLLSVADSGVGMTTELQARIFEPFFTTKERGKGTGLGLSTVLGIVEQSGGSISVSSDPGRGATFRIYSPCTDEGPDSMQLKTSPRTLDGTETILLVEDEKQLRALGHQILSKSGYHVIVAESPAHALTICQTYEGPIHLLLTDVVMPIMNGRELAERAAPLRPSMKVLYVSGYTDNTIVHHGVLEEGVAFLQKPITPDTLRRKLRDVLDAERRSEAPRRR